MRTRVNATVSSVTWLILFYFNCVQSTSANENTPSLLSLSKQLECAATTQEAKTLLESFRGINLSRNGLPNEWFGTSNSPSLHAATLDITLHALNTASKRFPEITLDIENVVLQWNYCEIFLDNTFYDFTRVGNTVEKRIAHADSPIDWQGFKAFGFLGEQKERFVFDAFKHDDSPYVFYESDYSSLFRKQCLPHPQTSKLFFSADTYFPTRIVHRQYKQSSRYDYNWTEGCSTGSTDQHPELAAAADSKKPDSQVPDIDEAEGAEGTEGTKGIKGTEGAKGAKGAEGAEGAELEAVKGQQTERTKAADVSEAADRAAPKAASFAEPESESNTDVKVATTVARTVDAANIESGAAEIDGKTQVTKSVQTAYPVDTYVPLSLDVDTREHLKSQRLAMYSYELLRQQKSSAGKIVDLGFYHYREAFRPEISADGIAEYSVLPLPAATAVQVAVNTISDQTSGGVLRKQISADDDSGTHSPVIPGNALADSASALAQRRVNESYRRRAGNGNKKPKKQTPTLNGDFKKDKKSLENSEPDEVASFPVVVEEDAVAPEIVIEQTPAPDRPPEKEKKVDAKQTRKKYYGLSGSLTLNNKSIDRDGFSITAAGSYKPIKDSYWFVRSSWNYRLSDEEFRYTWGIGYDDWHPGTFAFQLNHWGPLLPGDYLDLDNAVASATYKFNKNDFMKKHKLSSSVTLSQKISDEPIFSWSNSWSPAGKWFVRSTISQPIKGGETSWSYGFGYANYAPFTFSFEYNNWGYNKAFEDNFNENGLLSLSYRWRF